MSGDIDTTLAELSDRYGPFLPNAVIAQQLKLAMRHTQRWAELNENQKEALEQIASKISRILSGDPHYDDNWRDIALYAMLIVDWLNSPTVKGVAS